MIVREPPWHRGETLPRALRNTDIGEVASHLGEEWRTSLSTSTVHEAIETAASRDVFDPVRDYLEALAWDGTPRLATWLQTYCHAQDDTHTRLVGTRWMISAVARTYAPGCKADHVLVLEGKQGDGKSTVANVIGVKEAWVTDDITDIGSKCAAEQLQRMWIVELSELAAMRKTETETTKAFFSRKADNYRTPYSKVTEARPRRCVFIATTNRGTYLPDPTGARRFWIVPVGRCDTEGLRRIVDQLWAEAVTLYKGGVRWFPTAAEEELHAEAAESAQVDDVFAGKVARYLQNRTLCSLESVAEHLQIPATHLGRHQKSLGNAMHTAEWARGQFQVRGLRARLWFPKGRRPTAEQLRSFEDSGAKV